MNDLGRHVHLRRSKGSSVSCFHGIAFILPGTDRRTLDAGSIKPTFSKLAAVLSLGSQSLELPPETTEETNKTFNAG